MPLFATTYVARAAFSSWKLAGGALVHGMMPARGRALARARPRRRRRRSSRRRCPPCRPRTAAASRRRRPRRRLGAGDLLAPRGDARADPRPEQPLEPRALLGRRRTRPGRSRSGRRRRPARRRRPSARRPRRAPRRVAYSSWTTASVESVAAPRRSSAASAVDLPGAEPAGQPDEGDGARGSASYAAARRARSPAGSSPARRAASARPPRRLLGHAARPPRLVGHAAPRRRAPRRRARRPRAPRPTGSVRLGASAAARRPARRRSATAPRSSSPPANDVLAQAELGHVVEVARPRRRSSRRGRTWPSTRLTDSDRRRRSESISRILTRTSSPGCTTSRGFST